MSTKFQTASDFYKVSDYHQLALLVLALAQSQWKDMRLNRMLGSLQGLLLALLTSIMGRSKTNERGAKHAGRIR